MLRLQDTVCRACHAMTTEFRIYLALPDVPRARAAAEAALALLPGLEESLTHHVAHADLARLARVPAGRPFRVHPDLFDCLAIALRWRAATQGRFDPAWRCARRLRALGLAAPYALDPAQVAVIPALDGLQLDLGAIGKGFALDRMAELLRSWDTPAHCLIAGSGSSILAGEPPPGSTGWPVGIGPRTMHITRRAVAASGGGWRGNHILDPDSGTPVAATGTTWAFAAEAAAADALSTAFHAAGPHARRLASHLPGIGFAREQEGGSLVIEGEADLA